MGRIIFTISVLFLSTTVAFAITINEKAPLFSLRDNNDRIFFLSDHSNHSSENRTNNIKCTIINFFASYCNPCKKELPVLNNIASEFDNKGIRIIIIGYREDFDKIMAMLNEVKVDKPLTLSDKYGKVGEKYGVMGLPTTFIINSNLVIKDMIIGEMPNIENVLKDKIQKCLSNQK